MRGLNIIYLELKHFLKSKSKVLSFLFFVLACVYSIFNGFELQKKQIATIDNIELEENETISKMVTWFENGEKGPKDRSWIDITDPYWSVRYTPTYVIKNPSKLLPVGIGQAEQYGYYQKVSIWSSTFDGDIVEEISNYERLVNGNIDFSFLILFLLPLLLIILTYNLNGLEKDLKFDNLIAIQTGNNNSWIFYRLMFYVFLILVTVDSLFLSVGFINNAINSDLLNLILLSNIYILFFIILFYFIIIKSNSSTSIAFKMISLWLFLCVLIPGSVHQFVNIKHPTNYMTDFLDANRKDTYDVFKFTKEKLNDKLLNIYTDLESTKHAQDTSIDRTVVRNCMSAIVNQLNIAAINKIEQQNDEKNRLIKKTYWFNPLSFFQNKWNAITSTDYDSYKNYRNYIQSNINDRLELLTFECWDDKKVDLNTFNEYLKVLQSQ